jgi:hypothetical protein
MSQSAALGMVLGSAFFLAIALAVFMLVGGSP